MTPWLLLAIAVCAGAAWALWERARGAEARRLRTELAAARAREAMLDQRLVDARARSAQLEAAALSVSEACRAEVPAFISQVADPALAAQLAREHLAGVLERALAETTAAAARAGAGVLGAQPAGDAGRGAGR